MRDGGGDVHSEVPQRGNSYRGESYSRGWTFVRYLKEGNVLKRTRLKGIDGR